MNQAMKPKMLTTDAAEYLQVSLNFIHKLIKKNGLAYEKSQNKLFFGHSTSKELFKIKIRPCVISSHVVKGGVGKTTIIASLAIRLCTYGLRILVIDLDQQGNLTKMFNVDVQEKPVMIDILTGQASIQDAIINVLPGLDILPSRLENAVLDNVFMLKSLPIDRTYSDMIKEVEDAYDLIFIDCPPALGQSVAAASLASDFVFVPVNPDKFCIDGLRITLEELKRLKKLYKYKPDLRIIINKYDTRTNLSHEILQELVRDEEYSPALFKSYIRASQDFPNATAKGVSVYDTLKHTAASEDIDLWAKEIIDMLNEDQGNAENN